jgi:cell division septation protein DedD
MKRQIITVLFITCLFATSLFSLSKATFSENSYYGFGHPAWATMTNGTAIDFTTLTQLVADSGLTSWREAMYQDSNPVGYYTTIRDACTVAGLNFTVQSLSPSNGTAEGTLAEYNIIFDVGSAQDDWISNWGNIITALQPDAISVMNEPSLNGTYDVEPTSEEFQVYRNLIENCVNAWRAIDPNLIIVVENFPFNQYFDQTLYGFGATPVNHTGIVYSRHFYYSYDNTEPPAYQPEWQAYWDAITQGDLDAAKILLQAAIEYQTDPMTTQGKPVVYDEFGANLANPNVAVAVGDFTDICLSLGVGVVYYDIVPYGSGFHQEPSGALTDYYVFNAVGEAFIAPFEVTPEPTITPAPTTTPTPNPTATPTSTSTPTVTPVPTPTPFVSTAQAATNQVFTNVYLALGIAVVSTLIAGCYIIIAAFNSGNGNARFGVGLVIVSIIEVVIGVVVVNAFQGSMGTVAINLLSFKGINLIYGII